MHAINGTVGDPKFQEAEKVTIEVVVTVAIPVEYFAPETSHSDAADAAASDIQDFISEGAPEGVEIGVRSRVL